MFRRHRQPSKDHQGDEGRSDGKSDQKPKPPTPPPRQYPPTTTKIGQAPEIFGASLKKPSKPLPPPPPPPLGVRSRRGVTVEGLEIEAATEKVHQISAPFHPSPSRSENDDTSYGAVGHYTYAESLEDVAASSNFTQQKGLFTGSTFTYKSSVLVMTDLCHRIVSIYSLNH